MRNIEIGAKYSIKYTVRGEDSPRFLLDKGIGVLSTPRMISLMEEAARRLLEERLPEEYTSVGYHVDVYHKAPAPVGSTITAEAVVEGVEGRKIMFRVRVLPGGKVIGEGLHERYIVSWDSFRDKVQSITGH